MFSISEFNKDDLFQRYKRQTYLIAFPFGILLILLYINNMTITGTVFYMAMFMVMELFALTFLIWKKSHFLNAIELIFYFSLGAYFFLLIQVAINNLIQTNLLNLNSLSEQLNGLSMWLIVLLFGAFFTLKLQQTKILIICTFFGILGIFIYNIGLTPLIGGLTFAFAFRWINPLSALGITTLLIWRMGALQQSHASTDALTGVLNRHALYQVLSQEVERAIRYRRPFSIILFDIDEFKLINDTFGHLEGDKVLKELSKLVSSLMRKTDFIGRWGGEEFLLVLPETSTEAAQALAERFRLKIEETHFMDSYFIAASFGVSTYVADVSLHDLLEAADVALYQAKNNGRNQVVVNSMMKV